MAYKPNGSGPERDKAYPSEIAVQRPFGATRIQCEASYEEREEERKASLRGDKGGQGSFDEPIVEDACATFNRRLRSGHGERNAGEE